MRVSAILSSISLIVVCWLDVAGAEFSSSSLSFLAGKNLALRGGAAASNAMSSYVMQLEAVKASVQESAWKSLDDLKRQVVDEGKIVPNFGQVAETLCNQALEQFASQAPDADGGDEDQYFDASATSEAAAAYDAKLAELETSLDAPLQLLFFKQLAYLRENALEAYRKAVQSSPLSDYEAMLQADSQFVRGAQELTRPPYGSASFWDYSKERAFLQSVLNQMAEQSHAAQKVQVTAAQQQQTTLQRLHSQQQLLQQLQMTLYGQTSPWNVGVGYRIPDSNFNVQFTHQSGRASVQLSCVPDEYQGLLGASGFTNGVGPGNLGLSLNLSI